MTSLPEPSRVILDPSIVFSDEALQWIEDPELRPWLVVSRALMSRLEDAQRGETFLPYDEPDAQRIVEVRDALWRNEIVVYSVQQAFEEEALNEEARAICERLANGDEPLGDVLADEWAFLTTQSLAVIRERARHSLDAFRRAGAHVHEVTADAMRATFNEVRELRQQIPPPVLNAMKQVGPAADRVKWLVFGGHIAGLFVPHLGLSVVLADGIVLGIVVIAGDP